MTKKEFNHLKITLSALSKQQSELLEVKKELEKLEQDNANSQTILKYGEKELKKLERDNANSRTYLEKSENKKNEILEELSKNEKELQTFEKEKLEGMNLKLYLLDNFGKKINKLKKVEENAGSIVIGRMALIGLIIWFLGDFVFEIKIYEQQAGFFFCFGIFCLIPIVMMADSEWGFISGPVKKNAKAQITHLRNREKKFRTDVGVVYSNLLKKSKSIEGKLSRIEYRINRINNIENDLESKTKQVDKLNKSINDLTSKIELKKNHYLKLEHDIEENIKSIAKFIPYSEKLNLSLE